jgi:hypothetical protein
MTKLITRKQYLAHTTELFDAYWLQFTGEGYRSAVAGMFGPEELVNGGEHFNGIALARWDDAARKLYPRVKHELFTAAGEIYSLSAGVCMAKVQAKQLIAGVQA